MEEEMEFYLYDDEEGYLEAQAELEQAVRAFASQVAQIADKYPDVGLGDTSTDEAIVQRVYELIH